MARGRQEKEPGTEAFSSSPMRTPKLPVVRGKRKKTAQSSEKSEEIVDTSSTQPGRSEQVQTQDRESQSGKTSSSDSADSRAEQAVQQKSETRKNGSAPVTDAPEEISKQKAPETSSEKTELHGLHQRSSDSHVAKSSSSFGKWRQEREKERQAEIVREQELRHEQNRKDRLRDDPGLDGLLAEDRQKAASKQRRPLTRLRKILYTAGAFVLAVLLYIGVVFYSPLLAVDTIKVQGASLLDRVQVEQKLEPLKGTSLTRIDERKVRELIDQDYALRGVQVEAHPPHELVVTLKERTPVAVVRQDDKFVVVDSDGVGLQEVPRAEDAQVPLVDIGHDAPRDSAAFRTVSNVLSALPASILSQVKEARASSTSNINLTLKDGVMVQWGTAQESDLKAKVLTKLMEAVRAQQEEATKQGQAINKVNTYDVSSPRVPVTR